MAAIRGVCMTGNARNKDGMAPGAFGDGVDLLVKPYGV
jgi:hypothetical protein